MVLNSSLKVIFVVLFLFSSGCFFKVKVYTKGTCLNYLEEVSYTWKLDSIGSMGLRSILYAKMEDRCSIVGMKWDDIKDYFGTPNTEGPHTLSYYSKIDSTYHYPVLEYIAITLDKEKKKVIGFKRRFIDPW